MIDPFDQFQHPMEHVLSLQSLGEGPEYSMGATVSCTNTGVCGDTYNCGSTGWCGVTSGCGSTSICTSQSKRITGSAS